MKLFYSDTSPYSRKVRLVIIEKELNTQVKMILCKPFKNNPTLNNVNPLGKIPTLIMTSGEPLYDSPVICHYLDSLSSTKPLIPDDDKQRWIILRWEALADGITDAAYNIVMETRRPISDQSKEWITHWTHEINHGLKEIEATFFTQTYPVNLAHLAIASTLGYLDFRLPELLWENNLPNTHKWYDGFKTSEAMLVTKPK